MSLGSEGGSQGGRIVAKWAPDTVARGRSDSDTASVPRLPKKGLQTG